MTNRDNWNFPPMMIFAHPGNKYMIDSEKNAAKRCTDFAIDEFDKMVEFEANYDADKPDLEKRIGSKENRPLNLMVFVDQPVIKINSKPADFNITNYLFFVPFENDKDLILPDLHVVSIQADFDYMLDIREFYERNAWSTVLAEDNFGEKEKMPIYSPRLTEPVKIVKPAELIQRAEQLINYDSKKLYFNKE